MPSMSIAVYEIVHVYWKICSRLMLYLIEYLCSNDSSNSDSSDDEESPTVAPSKYVKLKKVIFLLNVL